MKKLTTVFFPLLALGILCGTSGCGMWPFHKDNRPKSSFKIIPVDEENPNIIDTPERAGTITRTVDVQTGPVQP